jgi:hypothetical protein
MFYILSSLFAFALTNDGYNNHFLTYRNTEGKMDYASLKEDTAREAWLVELSTATIPKTRNGKLAFWINAYNALTIDLIADNYPIDSIMKLDEGNVWKARKFTVAGKQVTLDEIENSILRPMGEPRIHAAVNCASIGCPSLLPTAFEEATLDAQLDQAMRAWVSGNAYRFEGEKLLLNNIFIWYKVDFKENSSVENLPEKHKDSAGIIAFVLPYLSETEQERFLAGAYEIGVGKYDWSLNKIQ